MHSADSSQRPLRAVDDHPPPATNVSTEPYLSIADVAAACGLPQPVIAQLVPRTWTEAGWMYTEAQLHEAVAIAAGLTRPDGQPTPPGTGHP
jgi:hypothetical protein